MCRHPLQIGAQTLHIRPVPATQGDRVFDSAHIESCIVEASHLHRMIDQIRIVTGQKIAKREGGILLALQGRGDAPICVILPLGRINADPAGLILMAVYTKKEAGPVKISVQCIEMSAAHREIPGIDAIVYVEYAVARPHHPGLLVSLLHRYRVTRTSGTDAGNVFREIPDHVAAGDPCRKR